MKPQSQALCVQHLSEDLSGVLISDVALPPVGPTDVRIQVHAAGLNFPDLLMTRGAGARLPGAAPGTR